MLDLDYSISELFIMGIPGTYLSLETQKNIEKYKPTQFIFFSHNFESKLQLVTLTTEIQKQVSNYSDFPAIISLDQEGGRVQRFRKEFTLLPTARRVGDQNSPHLAFELAKLQAKELFAAGINLNFAPVCDIHTHPDNPVIGDRAYGSTSEQVSKVVSAIVRGHASENVETCAKHFPGHGDTHVDSHYALPVVNTPLVMLRQREWIPFSRAMKEGCNFVMSAHILFPDLDPEFPATFSKLFLNQILRQELKFTGVVMSDDMEMGAVVNRYGEAEAPVLALQAGCDLLCYRSELHALLAMDAVNKALVDKKIDPARLNNSILKIRNVRKNLVLPSTSLSLENRLAIIGNPEHQKQIKDQYP